MNNVLIVCVGNICRSVTAERILRKELPSLKISSAGLAAQVGRGIEKNAAAILDVNGYDSDNHQARKINVELINESDLVLVMEKTHRDFIIERYPLASGKVFLLSQWNDGFEIADPYRKSKEMFSHVFDRIQKSCFDWIVKLGI